MCRYTLVITPAGNDRHARATATCPGTCVPFETHGLEECTGDIRSRRNNWKRATASSHALAAASDTFPISQRCSFGIGNGVEHPYMVVHLSIIPLSESFVATKAESPCNGRENLIILPVCDMFDSAKTTP